MLQNQLLAKFNNSIEIEGIATPSRTGFFELQIIGGPLAWSKKETNQFPSSQEALDQIFNAISQCI